MLHTVFTKVSQRIQLSQSSAANSLVSVQPPRVSATGQAKLVKRQQLRVVTHLGTSEYHNLGLPSLAATSSIDC